jgi:hypothetical protein
MPHVFRDAEKLEGHELVDGGDCVKLIKRFAPGLIDVQTSAWKEGRKVREVAVALAPGTAIATFVNGAYPHDRETGKHAAFFLKSAGAGFWVVDQWRNDAKKPRVSARHIGPRGKRPDGTYRDPSNNADAFSVIDK